MAKTKLRDLIDAMVADLRKVQALPATYHISRYYRPADLAAESGRLPNLAVYTMITDFEAQATTEDYTRTHRLVCDWNANAAAVLEGATGQSDRHIDLQLAEDLTDRIATWTAGVPDAPDFTITLGRVRYGFTQSLWRARIEYIAERLT
jgi:hypothetical protein